MLDAFRPAQIAHVYQAVNAVFHFYKSTKLSQVAHAAFYCGPDRIFLRQRLPGIRFQLFHAQRNAAFLGINIEYFSLNNVANVDQFGGMLHPLGPCHLADVHQPLNALFQFDEGAIVSDADYSAFHACAHGIAMRRIQPGIRCQLLEAQ